MKSKSLLAQRLVLGALVLTFAGCGDGDGGKGGGFSSVTPSLAITTSTLPFAPSIASYRASVTAASSSGGGFIWSVTGGALPPGIILLNGTPSATLAGSPTAAGTFNFILQVRDTNGQTATQTLSIQVANPTMLTVAGTGTSGFSGDGGAAILAQLDQPAGLAADAANNLFISDANNNRVRLLSGVTAFISTYAGGGASLGDGGLAVNAQLTGPAGLVLDPASNLLIADVGHNRIRQVNAFTTIITTVAGNGVPGFNGDGGAATLAQLNQPTDVAVDSAGNILIADSLNHRIRQVTPGGLITTVVGTGVAGFAGDGGLATLAQLNTPTGVGIDQAGNILIADRNNQRIRRVSATTGIITTVAGNGVQCLPTTNPCGDGGPPTSAQLNFPFTVRVDAAGSLLIADTNSNRVRRVDALTGLMLNVAGDGAACLDPSASPACGDTGLATAAQLTLPRGVVALQNGSVLVGDSSNQRVRRVGP